MSILQDSGSLMIGEEPSISDLAIHTPILIKGVVKLTDVSSRRILSDVIPSLHSPSTLLPPGELAMIVPLTQPLDSSTTALQLCAWSHCGVTPTSHDELIRHVQDAHVKLNANDMYQCRWNGCPRNGKGFNARYKMLIHVRTHTNEKPHQCCVCNKAFSRLENLKIHHRTHTGAKPYMCTYDGCDKAYSNSSDRFKHIQTHSIDRPYYCKTEGCNKRYTDPSSLRKHARMHGHRVCKDISDDVVDNDSTPQMIIVSNQSNKPQFMVVDDQICLTRIPQAYRAIPSVVFPGLIATTSLTPALIPLPGVPMGSSTETTGRGDELPLAMCAQTHSSDKKKANHSTYTFVN